VEIDWNNNLELDFLYFSFLCFKWGNNGEAERVEEREGDETYVLFRS